MADVMNMIGQESLDRTSVFGAEPVQGSFLHTLSVHPALYANTSLQKIMRSDGTNADRGESAARAALPTELAT